MRALGCASLALALVMATGPARAQTPEAQALGRQVAHAMLQALPFDELVVKGAKSSLGEGFGLKSRPEWDRYIVEALSEEVGDDRAVFERLFGHSLAGRMDLAELKAGLVIMSDPAIQTQIAAAATGKPATSQTPGPAADKAARSPAGKAFLADLDKINEVITPLTEDFVAEIAPGMSRRFADKIEAGERTRHPR